MNRAFLPPPFRTAPLRFEFFVADTQREQCKQHILTACVLLPRNEVKQSAVCCWHFEKRSGPLSLAYIELPIVVSAFADLAEVLLMRRGLFGVVCDVQRTDVTWISWRGVWRNGRTWLRWLRRCVGSQGCRSAFLCFFDGQKRMEWEIKILKNVSENV